MVKVFVILDGVGDRPISKLKGKTPLEKAITRNLDWFAKRGENGYCYTINEKIAPESDEAIWALIGHNPTKEYSGRGPLECFGRGIKINDGDLCLRVNFATAHNWKIVDRRVGRSLTSREAWQLGREVNAKVKLNAPFLFVPTIGHRGILIIRGDFSGMISNVDPAYTRKGNLTHAVVHPSFNVTRCRPLDRSKKAKFTAELVNDFVEQARNVLENSKINTKRKRKKLLPANLILPRDPGVGLPKVKEKMQGWCAVVAMPLEIGIAKLNGMKVHSFDVPESNKTDPYPQMYQSLAKTIRESKKVIKEGKFQNYWIHFKETDLPGHDGRFYDKVKMIEMIDYKFFSFLRKMKNLDLIVTADHSTPCAIKAHSTDPVPVLHYHTNKDDVQKFGESYCKKGSIGKLYGKDLLKKLEFV